MAPEAMIGDHRLRFLRYNLVMGAVTKKLHAFVGERGSVLLILSLIIFVFLSASVLMASTKLMEAHRAEAQYHKMIAGIAAEAGIHASFDATTSHPLTQLYRNGNQLVSYKTRLTGSDPFSIQSTGFVEINGSTYLSTVTATASNGRIVQWSYGR